VLWLTGKYRHLQGSLELSWDSLKTWELELPSTTRVPISPEVAEALFLFCLTMGFHADTPRAGLWLPWAVGVRLMSEVMARPGELAHLN
jgi:hypothetical protein